MTEEEIIILWRSGMSKFKVAEIYRKRYNQKIKIIRLDMKFRHSGKFITSYEALRRVEQIILKQARRRK